VVNDLGTSPDGASTAGGQAGEDRAQQVVDEITAAGGEAVADVHSVADPDGARALVETAVEQFGRLDAVVNNAGIVRRGFVHQVSVADYDFVVGVHLLGSIRVTQAAWEHLRAGGRGRVVFTSSSIGLLGAVSTAPYATSKLALVGLTRLLATAGGASGIRVNAVAPMAVTRLNQPVMEQIWLTATAS
jgi:NAD(P)-dependent dehydrogenase (short-subunit alcohol dehydrogenase family)